MSPSTRGRSLIVPSPAPRVRREAPRPARGRRHRTRPRGVLVSLVVEWAGDLAHLLPAAVTRHELLRRRPRHLQPSRRAPLLAALLVGIEEPHQAPRRAAGAQAQHLDRRQVRAISDPDTPSAARHPPFPLKQRTGSPVYARREPADVPGSWLPPRSRGGPALDWCWSTSGRPGGWSDRRRGGGPRLCALPAEGLCHYPGRWVSFPATVSGFSASPSRRWSGPVLPVMPHQG